MPKFCVLDEKKICDDCGECDYCDLNPFKICDNCGKCIDTKDEYRELKIDEIDLNYSNSINGKYDNHHDDCEHTHTHDDCDCDNCEHTHTYDEYEYECD